MPGTASPRCRTELTTGTTAPVRIKCARMSRIKQDLERQACAMAAITAQVLAVIGSLGAGERSTMTTVAPTSCPCRGALQAGASVTGVEGEAYRLEPAVRHERVPVSASKTGRTSTVS